MKTMQKNGTANQFTPRAARRAAKGGRQVVSGLLVMATLLAGSASVQASPMGFGNELGRHIPPYAPVRFAVISDPHLYSTRLGDSGAAFEAYLAQDPKLLRESEAILESALESVIRQKVRFVIIPGDLTKDGELVNHVLMAYHLAKLERRGIQVFVVPGNHDLNNPEAVVFRGPATQRIASVNAQSFRTIYQRFGFGQAIDQDRHSLSYVAEPVRGLWLLALDSTDSEQNEQLGHPKVGGKLSPETLAWVLAKLQQAQARGKKVIAFMHHGVNLNFLPQPMLFPDYLVTDWPVIGAQLNAAGLKAVFTGHYHSQDAAFPLDATGALVPGGLCDVETSSLVAFPCAYRVVTLHGDGRLDIASHRVTQIRAQTGGRPFQQYAEADLRTRLPALAAYRLETEFGVPHAEATLLAPYVADALIAGYAGDEMPDTPTRGFLDGLVGSPEPMHSLGMLLYGLWTDLRPGDNNLVLQLGGN